MQEITFKVKSITILLYLLINIHLAILTTIGRIEIYLITTI